MAWEAGADGSIGTSAGTDIVTKIYDAEGKVIRDAFQPNVFANDRNARDFDLTATHDGFALAAVDEDILPSEQTSIVYERYNFNGAAQSGAGTSTTIASENVAAEMLRNPQIATNLDPSNDDSYIAYDYIRNANSNHYARDVDQDWVLSTQFISKP